MSDKNLPKEKFMNEVHVPRWEELPEIDLYMDQIIAFIDSALGEFYKTAGSGALTKSMVNNYVKARIIKPPVNKKYSRLSVAMIVVVYIMKNCFSTEETSQLIKMGLNLPANDITYNRFCQSLEEALYAVFSGSIHVDDLAEKGRERRYLMDNFALSFACKAYVQKMFLSEVSRKSAK